VVQRQDDKYVYVEIGDPDAPEMVMALSHLDSPTPSQRGRLAEGRMRLPGEKIGLSAQAVGRTMSATTPISAVSRRSRHAAAAAASSATAGKPTQGAIQPSVVPAR
jgi:hypothetical protein